MTSHSGSSTRELNKRRMPTLKPNGAESSTAVRRNLLGRLLYWWSLFVAGALLLFFGPPAIFIAWLIGKREHVYPWAEFGAAQWLRLSGVRVRVHGRELLDPKQPYVFISNHHSYLDTATLFLHTGRRIGLLAKKELLKVPILGYGMGYVNVLAIDRSNRERALETTKAATDRIRSGISFGVFAEGTRARPGVILPFKKGAFYMAAQAGVPVVPVAIKNTDVLMGKGTGVARPGVIDIVFMPPISTDKTKSDEEVNQLVQKVHSLVARELGLSNSVKASA
jgi:1-acyl-sn-glycerol-3-phosphate acyltransferase